MLLPMPDLTTREGRPAPWPALWQRRPVLVLLAHDGCERCAEVASAIQRLEDELAEDDVQAIVVKARERPAGNGTLGLMDPQGRLARALDVEPGALVAADRFFEVRKLLDAHEGDPEALVRRALGGIELSLIECPECGAPTW